jgi:hypothetical protein
VFDRKAADTLPSFRGKGVDHDIELEKDKDVNEPDVPFGPLYQMGMNYYSIVALSCNNCSIFPGETLYDGILEVVPSTRNSCENIIENRWLSVLSTILHRIV